MKMTPEWMGETVTHLESWSFTTEKTTEPRELDGRTVFVRTRYTLERAEQEKLVLDVLVYPDHPTTYWLEVVDWHGLVSTAYRLDSWRHRPDRVEFKYGIDPETGTGLSFTLHKDRLS